MEQHAGTAEMLSQFATPAFLVREGIITDVNENALHYQIEPGKPITDLICIGAEEYSSLSTGKLCLCLQLGGVKHNATAARLEQYDIFCLESEYTEPELRAFSLAAQFFREPLGNAMNSVCAILENTAPEDAERIKQLNRSLYQIHRAVCNMSDAANLHTQRITKIENRDIVSIVDEVINKASTLLNVTDQKIAYQTLNEPVCCNVDAEKLSRGILNLISNAAKYSSKDTPITVSVKKGPKKFYISVENDCDGSCANISSIFSRFLREPSLGSGSDGIGLGITIARNTAIAHGGTLLIEQPDEHKIRFCLSVSTESQLKQALRSPVLLPVDYAGGYDHALIELSDVLSPELYE